MNNKIQDFIAKYKICENVENMYRFMAILHKELILYCE